MSEDEDEDPCIKSFMSIGDRFEGGEDRAMPLTLGDIDRKNKFFNQTKLNLVDSMSSDHSDMLGYVASLFLGLCSY